MSTGWAEYLRQVQHMLHQGIQSLMLRVSVPWLGVRFKRRNCFLPHRYDWLRAADATDGSGRRATAPSGIGYKLIVVPELRAVYRGVVEECWSLLMELSASS